MFSVRRSGKAPALLLLLALLPAGAFGQAQTTGRISGRVVDDGGHAIAGATVTVLQTELQLERSAITGRTGDFLFSLLPTGPYGVTVVAPGKQPEVLRLRVGVGETVPLDVRLAAGDIVAETITVTASATALETTSVGENFNYEREVDRLPITNRGIEDVALLAPNVSYGPTGGTMTIAGAPSFDTVVILDGAEISDPYFGSAPDVFLEDAIEEVQVLTAGVSARYGRFQGGVINAVTKSGTNQFQGSLRTDLTSESWDSATPFGESQSEDMQEIYQMTLGGPILRDRLWFFGGLRKIPTTSAIRTTTYTREPISETYDEQRWQGKLRAALGSNHLVDFSYLDFDSAVANYVGLISGEAKSVGERADPRTTQTLAYQGVLSANTFLELQATRKNVQIVSGGSPANGDPFIEYFTLTTFNNGWWDATDPAIRDNETLSGSATHTLTSQRFGSHTFEGGVQRVVSTTGGENRQSPTGLNFVAYYTDPPLYAGSENGVSMFNVISGAATRWTAIPLGGDQKLTNTALYLQDRIDLRKVRLDLGVRFETYAGAGPDPSYDYDFSGAAPRLAVTYSPTPSWQVQASLGRYISRFNDNVANSATGVASGPLIEEVYTGATMVTTAAEIERMLRDDSLWTVVAGYSGPDQPTYFQAHDLEPPFADDINLSVRHALPGSTGSVVLAYVHRDYRNLIDQFVGGACDYRIDFDLPCPSGSVRTIVDPATGADLADVDVTVWANDNRARRRYRAWTAMWDYRPRQQWQLGGNYTYGKTTGNYEGESGNLPASGSPLGDYERAINVAAAAPYGYTDDDIRHRLNVFASYTFNFARAGELSLGSILRSESGRAYSLAANIARTEVADYNAETATPYTYYFGPNGEGDQHVRGQRRFDGWWAADLSARYQFRDIAGVRPFVRAVVLNALNNHAVIRHQTTGRAQRDAEGRIVAWAPAGDCTLNSAPSRDCQSFGRIRSESDYQLPRSFQFSLGLQF